MTFSGALGIGARRLAVVCAFLAVAATSSCGYGQPVPIPPPKQVGSSGLVVTPSDISISPGQITTVNVSERGYGGPFMESDDCSGIVTVLETGGTSFKVTAVADGLCSITISDQSGGSQAIPVSIQSVIIGGQ